MEPTITLNRANQQTVRDIVGIFFLEKRTFVLIFAGVVVSALLLSLLAPPIYQTTGELVVKPQFSKPLVFDQDPTRMNVFSEVTEQTMNSVIFLLSSDDVLREVVVRHSLAENSNEKEVLEQVNALRGRLSAEPLTNSNMIRLTLKGRDPQGVVAQLNSVIDAYIKQHIRVNQATEGRFEFFDDQTRQFHDKFSQINSHLAETSKALGVVRPEIQLDGNLTLIREMESSIVQLTNQANAVDAKLGSFRSALKRFHTQDSLSGLPAEALLQYPALVEMEKSLAQLIINRQRANNDYQPASKQATDANSQYFNMKEMIHRQMQQIVSDLEAEAGGYRSGIGKLNGRIGEFNARNAQLAKDATILKKLQMEHDLTAENYKLYSAKKEEARINREKDRAQFANIAVASRPALPVSPWFPKRGLIMMLSIPLGFMLALAITAGVYAMRKKLWTPTDIKLHTRLRYLGSLDAVGSA